MRSVALSNTVLVVTPTPDDSTSNFSDDAVVICDQLNEVIELVPIVPKLHKLYAMIRDRQYDEGQEDDTREHENKVRPTMMVAHPMLIHRLIVDAFHVPGRLGSNTGQRKRARKRVERATDFNSLQ
jgi:hypothetical protein